MNGTEDVTIDGNTIETVLLLHWLTVFALQVAHLFTHDYSEKDLTITDNHVDGGYCDRLSVLQRVVTKT